MIQNFINYWYPIPLIPIWTNFLLFTHSLLRLRFFVSCCERASVYTTAYILVVCTLNDVVSPNFLWTLQVVVMVDGWSEVVEDYILAENIIRIGTIHAVLVGGIKYRKRRNIPIWTSIPELLFCVICTANKCTFAVGWSHSSERHTYIVEFVLVFHIIIAALMEWACSKDL